jgi:hypothetical protein
MAHQWLKWPRRSAGQWNPQPRLVAELHAQLTRPAKLELMRAVFRLHPEVKSATLIVSRAKSTHTHRSDAPAVRKVVACAFDHAGAQGDDQCGVTARLSKLTSGSG